MDRDSETKQNRLIAVLVVLGTALYLNLLSGITLNVINGFRGDLALLLQFFTVTIIGSLGLTYLWRGSGYLRGVLRDIWPRLVLNPSRVLEPHSRMGDAIIDELFTNAHTGYRRYSSDEILTAIRHAGVILTFTFFLQSLTFVLLVSLNSTGQLEGLVPVVTETRGVLIGLLAIFSPLIGAFALSLSVMSGSGIQEVILLILILPFSVMLTPVAGNIIAVCEALNSACIRGLARLTGEEGITSSSAFIYLFLVILSYIIFLLFSLV